MLIYATILYLLLVYALTCTSVEPTDVDTRSLNRRFIFDTACSTAHCSANGICTTFNETGEGFHCLCQLGFVANDCSLECTDAGYCHGYGSAEVHGHGKDPRCACRCKAGYFGPRCDKACTDASFCSGHGLASLDHHHDECSCECEKPFFLSNCQSECSSHAFCNDRGHGILHHDWCECRCRHGFHGTRCQTECTDQGQCNGGTSHYAIHQGRCVCTSCPSGFYGEHCELACTDADHCNGRGLAVLDLTTRTCLCTGCEVGFYGPQCQFHLSTTADPVTHRSTTVLPVTADTTTPTSSMPTVTSTLRSTALSHPALPTTEVATGAPITGSPTPISERYLCDKDVVRSSQSAGVHLSHPASHSCSPQSAGTNEDLVLSACNLTTPDTWRRGANVMAHCAEIQPYVPIAIFLTDIYHHEFSQSGIFITCTETDILCRENRPSFQMLIQKCGSAPEVAAIKQDGSFLNDPHGYFLIQ